MLALDAVQTFNRAFGMSRLGAATAGSDPTRGDMGWPLRGAALTGPEMPSSFRYNGMRM
jgi:hypothetical protein